MNSSVTGFQRRRRSVRGQERSERVLCRGKHLGWFIYQSLNGRRGRNSTPGGAKRSSPAFVWRCGVSTKKHVIVSAFRLKELIGQWRIKAHTLQPIVGNTSRKMCLGSVRVPKTGTYLGLECVNRGGRWWAAWRRFPEEASVSRNSEAELV